MTRVKESTPNEIKVEMTNLVLIETLIINHGGWHIQNKCGHMHIREKTIMLHASRFSAKAFKGV